jgi:hypothetical protein
MFFLPNKWVIASYSGSLLDKLRIHFDQNLTLEVDIILLPSHLTNLSLLFSNKKKIVEIPLHYKFTKLVKIYSPKGLSKIKQ